MSEPIEQRLSLAGIPYEVIGGRNFYNRKEVKDCLYMLKFLANKKDSIAFHKVASLVKGMGNVTIGKIENYANDNHVDLVEASRTIMDTANSVSIKRGCKVICDVYDKQYDMTAPSMCLGSLVKNFEYNDYLVKKYDSGSDDRKENVSQVIQSSGMFNGQDDGVSKYLQQVSLVTANDKEIEGSKVSLMTYHSAKGLEFPIVFMVGVEQNILPHRRCLEDDPMGGVEEERRLCYVGMTRAEKMLYVTWCKYRSRFGRYGQTVRQKGRYSQFLIEAGLVQGEDYCG